MKTKTQDLISLLLCVAAGLLLAVQIGLYMIDMHRELSANPILKWELYKGDILLESFSARISDDGYRTIETDQVYRNPLLVSDEANVNGQENYNKAIRQMVSYSLKKVSATEDSKTYDLVVSLKDSPALSAKDASIATDDPRIGLESFSVSKKITLRRGQFHKIYLGGCEEPIVIKSCYSLRLALTKS